MDNEAQLKEMAAVLDEAKKIVTGTRNKDYGSPRDNHARTAYLWSQFLGFPVTPQQVCTMMILLKISRAMNKPTRDTFVDIAGYAANAYICQAPPKGDPEIFERLVSYEP